MFGTFSSIAREHPYDTADMKRAYAVPEPVRRRDVPGEFTVTANNQRVVLTQAVDGIQTVWLRGYSLIGAPMGVSSPVYNQLLVQLPERDLQMQQRCSDLATEGYPLQVRGANTYVQYETPRLFCTSTAQLLKGFTVRVVTGAGQSTDIIGNPLFASLTLELLYSTCPLELDPALSFVRGQALQEGALRY